MRSTAFEAQFTPLKVYAPPVLTVYGTVSSLTQSGTGSVVEASTRFGLPTRKPSDRQLKENVVQVGMHPLGFGLYFFDYVDSVKSRCGSRRQFGVMADEVQTVIPHAVSVDTYGFMQVDYDALGIKLARH